MPWVEIALVTVLTTPVALVIHELGHFVAARFLMLEVVSFQAGPFLIDWNNGQGDFRFRPFLWLSAGSLRVKMPVEAPAKKRILLTAAGPASSLLFSSIYWLAPLPDFDWDEGAFLPWILPLLAASSFVIFLLTTVPLRAPPWNPQRAPTDGYKILTLLRSMNKA